MFGTPVEHGTLAFAYGEKLADEEQKEGKPSFLRRHPGLVAGAVVAPLTYALLRRKQLSANPRLRALQEAAKGRYTHVIDEMDPGSWVGRTLDRLRYAGGGNVIYRRSLHGNADVPGAVRHLSPSSMNKVKGDVDGGHVFNDYDLDTALDDKLHEYKFFEKHAPGSMGRSEGVGDVLKSMGQEHTYLPDDPAKRKEVLDAIQSKLREKYPQGYLMKELDGLQSGGRFPTNADDLHALLNRYTDKVRSGALAPPERGVFGASPSDFTARMRELQQDPDFSGRVVQQLVFDPRQVMVQEKLPIDKLTGWRARLNKMLGQSNPSRELRVHVENGVASPELTTSRFDILGSVFDKKRQREAASYAQGIVDRLPAHQRGTFAMDIAPLQGGGYKMIESNPTGRSGLLFTDPRMAANMHKHYTGQYSHMVSGLGAGVAGLGAAGLGVAGGALANKLTEPSAAAPAQPVKPIEPSAAAPAQPVKPIGSPGE